MLTQVSYYAGLDVHRKTISYCAKTNDQRIAREGSIAATREALREWDGSFLESPGVVGMRMRAHSRNSL